jgi:putative SOS response-associated peptidase YedK
VARRAPNGEIIKSCDVTLAEHDWPAWLGEIYATEADLKSLLRPFPSDRMELWPVDRRVGDVRNEGQELVAPIKLAV